MEKGTKVNVCSGRYWCPVIEYNGEGVLIRDDYGNEVQLSPEYWNSFIKKVREGELDIIPQE